jgi:hypothetical protein
LQTIAAGGRSYCILRSGGTTKAARSFACAVPALTMRATSIQNGPTGMWAYFLRAIHPDTVAVGDERRSEVSCELHLRI